MKTQFLATSKTIPGDDSTMTHRIVLRHIPESVQPFVTHMQVFPPDRPAYFVQGHYFSDLKDAFEDFGKRSWLVVHRVHAS